MTQRPRALARQRDAAIQIRKQAVLERTGTYRLAIEMQRYGMLVAERYAVGGATAIGLLIGDHEARLYRVLGATYRDAIGLGATHVLDTTKSRRARVQTKDLLGDLERQMTDWAGSLAAARVTAITGTTQRRINAIIVEAVREGAGQSLTAYQLQQALGGVSTAARARTIARTEIHSAFQRGSLLGAESLDLTLYKVWTAAHDERTRATHAEADGQVVAMRNSFNVGGSPLSHPGDPSGAGAEIINCRCAMTYQEESV